MRTLDWCWAWKIEKIASELKVKSSRRFCVDRNSAALCLPDPVRQIRGGRKVSYEPRLPAVQTCVKRSLIPNRCCGENGARRVTGASYTLNVIWNSGCSAQTHTRTHTVMESVFSWEEIRGWFFFFSFFFLGRRNRNAAKTVFSSVRWRETKFDQIKCLFMWITFAGF